VSKYLFWNKRLIVGIYLRKWSVPELFSNFPKIMRMK